MPFNILYNLLSSPRCCSARLGYKAKGTKMNPRFLPVLSALLLSVLASARAQDHIQVFGGYSHLGYSMYDLYSGPWMLQGFNGWDAAATFKLVPHLGAEADFGGAYSSTYQYNLRIYMGGPRVSAGYGKISAYGHALFGGLAFNDTGHGGGSATSFEQPSAAVRTSGLCDTLGRA